MNVVLMCGIMMACATRGNLPESAVGPTTIIKPTGSFCFDGLISNMLERCESISNSVSGDYFTVSCHISKPMNPLDDLYIPFTQTEFIVIGNDSIEFDQVGYEMYPLCSDSSVSIGFVATQ